MSDNSNKDWTVFVPEIKWTLWDRITMPFYRVRNFFRDKWWGSTRDVNISNVGSLGAMSGI